MKQSEDIEIVYIYQKIIICYTFIDNICIIKMGKNDEITALGDQLAQAYRNSEGVDIQPLLARIVGFCNDEVRSIVGIAMSQLTRVICFMKPDEVIGVLNQIRDPIDGIRVVLDSIHSVESQEYKEKLLGYALSRVPEIENQDARGFFILAVRRAEERELIREVSDELLPYTSAIAQVATALDERLHVDQIPYSQSFQIGEYKIDMNVGWAFYDNAQHKARAITVTSGRQSFSITVFEGDYVIPQNTVVIEERVSGRGFSNLLELGQLSVLSQGMVPLGVLKKLDGSSATAVFFPVKFLKEGIQELLTVIGSAQSFKQLTE